MSKTPETDEKKIEQKLKPNVKKLQSKIKHIVVLMLENRSFDNLLGWLYAYNKPPFEGPPPGGQHYEGLSRDLWNPLDNIDADGIAFKEKVPIEMNGEKKWKYGKEIPNPEDFCVPKPDPGEGYKDTNHQLFQEYNVAHQYPPPPINMGFVQNYQNAMLYGAFSFGDKPGDPRDIMKCYTPAQTPVLSELARSFAVCDHYHSSVPSQTFPNRDFVHAATSNGNLGNKPAQCYGKTIYNQLAESGVSWGIFGGNSLAKSGKKRQEDLPGEFGDGHFSLTRLVMKELHDPKFDDNFGTMDDFQELCKKGDLPSYSFLEPHFSGPGQNDQKPPADITPGEQLMADVYNMIKDSPSKDSDSRSLFEQTLLIITYDEHGGCYDHVPPPGGARNPDPENRPGQDGFLFNRFGVRVPCVVVNPYIEKGLIARPDGYTPFDHTSVIKTVQNCFGLKGHLTERDKAAPDFSGLLTLDEPRTGKEIPDVKPLKCKTEVDLTAVNALLLSIIDALEEVTGISKSEDQDDHEHILRTYQERFGSRKAAVAT